MNLQKKKRNGPDNIKFRQAFKPRVHAISVPSLAQMSK